MMRFVYQKDIMKLLTKWMGGEYLLNYRLYKKYHEDQNNQGALKLASITHFAIVVQGPVISDSDFTVETLKLYRKNFPDSILILSTWQISDAVSDILKSLDVCVIQNKLPENPGIANINLQIVTSRAGVLAARDVGAQFVLKTRTDQRIFHPSMDAYLFALIEAFPLLGDFSSQRNRMVSISLNTLKYRIYGVSDMFLFGHIDDMILYWDIPLDGRRNIQEKIGNVGLTWRQFVMWHAAEVYLCTKFLNRLGRNVKYTLADSFDVLRTHFIIIDQEAIDLYWHKYTINADRYTTFALDNIELKFNDWLLLYHAPEKILVDEAILDQPISLSK